MTYVPEVRGARLLVVDDDSAIRAIVSESLRRHGFEVFEESDGRAALEVIRHTRLDLVVLDIGLPGLHGLDLLSEVRSSSQLPVIILSGRSDEWDRVLGLKMGADDYLAKPFSSRELVARVESVLRRSPPTSGRCLDFDDLVVDQPRGHRSRRTSGADVQGVRPPRPSRLLPEAGLLAGTDPQRSVGFLVGLPAGGDGDQHVRRIRQKIEQDPEQPRWIKTLREIGYQFVP